MKSDIFDVRGNAGLSRSAGIDNVFDIEKSFYNCLASDYVQDMEKSIIYRYYRSKLDIITDDSGNNPAEMDGFNTIRKIVGGYRRLSQEQKKNGVSTETEKHVFDYIVMLFGLLVEHKNLYNHPINLPDRKQNGRFNIEELENEELIVVLNRDADYYIELSNNESSGSSGIEKELTRKDEEDLERIRKVLWPFVKPLISLLRESEQPGIPAGVNAKNQYSIQYLKNREAILSGKIKVKNWSNDASKKGGEEKKFIKNYMQGLVLDVYRWLRNRPEITMTRYRDAKLLNCRKNGPLDAMIEEIIARSIQKSFEDYLYSYGFRLTTSGTKKNAGIHIERLEEKRIAIDNSSAKQTDNGDARQSELKYQRVGKGRKGTKTDNTIMLLSDICRNQWQLSFDGKHLLNLEFRKMVIRLFRYICDKYSNQNNVTQRVGIDILLAQDSRTGVSLHLLGNECYPSGYEEKLSACAFAIFNRNYDTNFAAYEMYSLEDDGDLLLYGLEKEDSEISDDEMADLYRTAVKEYFSAVDYAKEQSNKENVVDNGQLLKDLRNGKSNEELAEFIRQYTEEEARKESIFDNLPEETKSTEASMKRAKEKLNR